MGTEFTDEELEDLLGRALAQPEMDELRALIKGGKTARAIRLLSEKSQYFPSDTLVKRAIELVKAEIASFERYPELVGIADIVMAGQLPKIFLGDLIRLRDAAMMPGAPPPVGRHQSTLLWNHDEIVTWLKHQAKLLEKNTR